MRKLMLIVLFTMACHSAVAGWVEVGRSRNAGGGITTYADPTTVQGESRVKMWDLFDFQTIQATEIGSSGVKRYLSGKRLQEYDCVAKQSRMLEIALFPENMGNGAPVYYDVPQQSDWVPIAAGSMGHTLWNAAYLTLPNQSTRQ